MAPVSAAEGGGLPIRCHFQIVFFFVISGVESANAAHFQAPQGNVVFSTLSLSLFFPRS